MMIASSAQAQTAQQSEKVERIEVTGSRVHLGFQAPSEVPILRKEIDAAKHADLLTSIQAEL